jgi:hypothetical protein
MADQGNTGTGIEEKIIIKESKETWRSFTK